MNSLMNNDQARKLIVEHYSKPQNKELLATKDSVVFHHFSNSCVDDFHIELTFKNDVITAGRFTGIGCAISSASVDIFLGMVSNKNKAEALKLVNEYQKLLQGEAVDGQMLGNLLAFTNVAKQKARVRCAEIIAEAISSLCGETT